MGIYDVEIKNVIGNLSYRMLGAIWDICNCSEAIFFVVPDIFI